MQSAYELRFGCVVQTTRGNTTTYASLWRVTATNWGECLAAGYRLFRQRTLSIWERCWLPSFGSASQQTRVFRDGRASGISISWKRGLFAGVFVLGLSPAYMHAQTYTTTQALTATVSAKVKLVTVPSSVTLVNTGTVFNPYTGSMTLTYRARTTTSSGMGAVTLKATSDFSPGTGPLIANGDLTYICASADLGTACSAQTVSMSSQTSVVAIGAGACTGGGAPCSAADPNAVVLSFTLANKPTFKTGSYSSAVLTFTISAL